MPNTYVIIDIETTGLDPRHDAIIEVAAVVLQGNDILDEFTTLVNPRREIPPHITQMTGITGEMAADAPTMFQVRSRLRAILGDHVLVGHNVGFDLSFLREERLGIGHHRLDTVTLASILVPEAGRYNLETLVRVLNLPDPAGGQTHRALDDAEQTVELFLALRERAAQLPIAQLDELVRAGHSLGWPETLFFAEILAEKAKTAFAKPELRRVPRLFRPPKLDGRIPVAKEKPDKIDPETIAGMIRPGGNLSRLIAEFEYRPQQEEMLTAVAEAFNRGDHVLVEAGTGTGKSLAYLIPAAFWSHQNGRRVVISTNTINLQDQLIHKDIPELQRALPFDLRAAVRKGRSNYLCTRLFQQMRHTGPHNEAEMVLFARILLWLPRTQTGDVTELPLRNPGERLAWSRLNADSACTAEQCDNEQCPLFIARRRAELAHILIVNHALLMANIATGETILPEFTDLIIDEAHHLEAAVTDGLSFRADKRFLEAILDEVNKPRSGLLPDLQSRVEAAMPAAFSDKFGEITRKMRRAGQDAQMELDEFFTTLTFFLSEFTNRRSQFAQQIRLTTAARAQPGYDEVEISWSNLSQHLKIIADGFNKLAKGLNEIAGQYDVADSEDLMAALASNGRDLAETRENIDGILLRPRDDMIYWAEIFKDRLSLHAAPLHVGPLVEANIFKSKETVILTSATLRTASPGAYAEEPDFNYLRDRLHAFDANELAVGSPFDYKNSTLLYLLSDIPEPNQPGYQRYVEEAIVQAAVALGGRTMVLFTSYGQLSQTARAITGRLAGHDIVTLAQTQGASRQQLLETFKQPDARAVLLGTRSFWEGVDVPGAALQAVLIAKLPFDVPSDPIFAARSETFDNAFFEYAIPEAVLRFRQGFGRLNRRMSDEGAVVILDKRVLSKRYGQLFIDALPECTVIRQRTDRVGELLLRWLNRER